VHNKSVTNGFVVQRPIATVATGRNAKQQRPADLGHNWGVLGPEEQREVVTGLSLSLPVQITSVPRHVACPEVPAVEVTDIAQQVEMRICSC